jgi:hypothetical protein
MTEPLTRTGFPRACPTGRAVPVLAINCQGCEYWQQNEAGHWRCDHEAYQDAPGVHFCAGCGRELGPYFEAHGWLTCGGPVAECRDPIRRRLPR